MECDSTDLIGFLLLPVSIMHAKCRLPGSTELHRRITTCVWNVWFPSSSSVDHTSITATSISHVIEIPYDQAHTSDGEIELERFDIEEALVALPNGPASDG